MTISGFDAHTLAAAQGGDAVAQRTLGRFYLYGPDAQRDPAKAEGFFKAAAAQGDVRAMIELADMSNYGIGVPRDHAQAVVWDRMAAEHGDAEGMERLAYAYQVGAGLPQDDAAALKWRLAAAQKGQPDAMRQLGVLYFEGRIVPKDYEAAEAWLHKAADAGDVVAMRNMSYLYTKGLGVPANPEMARQWAKTATGASHWAVLPTEQEMANVYPVEASMLGIAGVANFVCRIAPDRSVEDCHVVSEVPPGFGFGDAGLQLTPKMRLSPGLPAGSPIDVPVRFASPTGVLGNPGRADACAAEGMAYAKFHTPSPTGAWWARYWVALSRRDAKAAGLADTPDRLAALEAAAEARVAAGKDGGILGGLINSCTLR